MTSTDRSGAVRRLILLLAIATYSLPTVAAGQSASDVPLFLAIPESFPEVDGRVVLLREPGRDIVLLRASDATAETLSVALNLLRRLNASTPRRDGQGQMVPVTGYVLRRPLEAGERERLDEALTRLREQPTGHVGNLGPGRSMPFLDGDG